METALTFWSTQVLETAVADTARLVYTGQFQAGAGTATPAELGEKFRKELCTRVVALFDCNAMVKIDVRTFTAFPDATVGLPINNGQFDTADFGYRASGPNEIVVVRAAMEYPVFTSLLNSAQGNLSNGKRLIMASATFRNEPFGQ